MNTQFFPFAIFVVMLSLGLSLTLSDFRRAYSLRLPLAVALVVQLVLLPIAGFAITQLFALPPVLALGLMLMAAMPGGALSNIFSHLVDGDVALNLTLTAINAVFSILTLPLIMWLTMNALLDESHMAPPQPAKFAQVLAFVAVPVMIGMILRNRQPRLEERLRKPMKVVAALVVLAAAIIAITTGWTSLMAHAGELMAAVLSFNVLSLAVGYWVPRAMHMEPRQALAISLEIGLHNGALAISLAMSPHFLNDPDMAIPAAIYGVSSLFVASAFVAVVRRVDRGPSQPGGE